MLPDVINLSDKLGLFDDQWSPKTIAEMEGFHFKLAKLEGDFIWHAHDETDEAFFVLSGELRIDFRDGARTLKAGEMLVVPRNVEHKPFAAAECHVMVLVRMGTVNTGNAEANKLTADAVQWI